MINVNYLQAFTRSIEDAEETPALLQRWVDRAKELERELSWRVLSLSRFINELPDSSYESYADALISALEDFAHEVKREDIDELESKVKEFATKLETRNYGEKAKAVRTAFDKITQSSK